MHCFRKLVFLVFSLVLCASTLHTVSADEGEDLYNNYCSACHNLGVAGAPRITDQEAWKPRLAQGKKVLYDHAINGFVGQTGSMPPKGGFVGLSDEQIQQIVDYIIFQVM